jgi:hypothetical protein
MKTAQQATEVVDQRWPGWHVWITRERKSIVATRVGRQQPPVDDGVWARTLIADDWTELERQLGEQTANDAAATA